MMILCYFKAKDPILLIYIKNAFWNCVWGVLKIKFSLNKYWNSRFRTKNDTGFRLVYELSYLGENFIFLFFCVRVPPFVKNWPKFISFQTWQFIHQSKAHVEFLIKMLFLNFFELISGLKNPKNCVKIRLFIGRFRKSCFWP